jgi:hypothetical protein
MNSNTHQCPQRQQYNAKPREGSSLRNDQGLVCHNPQKKAEALNYKPKTHQRNGSALPALAACALRQTAHEDRCGYTAGCQSRGTEFLASRINGAWIGAVRPLKVGNWIHSADDTSYKLPP